ncbi:MAG: C10 family peptidase [Bacteroidota bacterium]
MKKITLLFTLLILLWGLNTWAKPVEIKNARIAAKNFYYERLVNNMHRNVPYSAVNFGTEFVEKEGMTPVYYVFNFEENGYIIISADDCCYPVIGYSFDTKYTEGNQPDNFVFWMGARKQEIAGNIRSNVLPDKAVSDEWTRILTMVPSSLPDSPAAATDVEPLLKSMWDQTFPYNFLCPADAGCNSFGGHVTVGCVATAMSQIMYYWRWPQTGNGQHCDSWMKYGQLCADFGNTTYDWNGMTDTPSKECTPISTICYHAGISVNMQYNSDNACSSGAYTASVPYSLITYFKYASTCAYYSKSSYSGDWNTLLTGDLDAGRPIQYGGQGPGGGHSWVCDGYQATNYYHMNWGWSGSSNGYFYLTNLNPGGYTFNSGQEVVVHIQPNTAQYPTFCSGNTIVNTYDFGSIEDGSGPAADYQNNSNCSWLIAPDDSISTITLTFARFATATGDEVKVYDGADATAPLIGIYSGTPGTMPVVSSTGPRMFITFTTNGSGTSNGWMANYTTTVNKFCESTSNLTDAWGNITDGSGHFQYRNQSSCRWNIIPPGASKIVLTVNSFNTEEGNDKLMIYDMGTGTLMATLSGAYSTPPGPYTTTTGKMMLQWFTNNSVRGEGWDVSYSPMVGTDEQAAFNSLSVYPNPASELVNISFSIADQQNITIELLSLKGETLFTENLAYFKGRYLKSVDVSRFSKGIYMLRLKSDQGTTVKKIVVQ